MKDLFIKNMDDLANQYSLEDYIDTLTKWNQKFSEEENWKEIVYFLLEGMFHSLGEIVRDNYGFISSNEGDEKFAYSFEISNNYEYKCGFGNDKLNQENLIRVLAGFGIFHVLHQDEKTYLLIQNIAVRPDLQHNGIFQKCLTELFSNTEQYFHCNPDYVILNIHKDNLTSQKAFAKFGIDDGSNMLENNDNHSIQPYQVDFEQIKQTIKNSTEQNKEHEKQ